MSIIILVDSGCVEIGINKPYAQVSEETINKIKMAADVTCWTWSILAHEDAILLQTKYGDGYQKVQIFVESGREKYIEYTRKDEYIVTLGAKNFPSLQNDFELYIGDCGRIYGTSKFSSCDYLQIYRNEKGFVLVAWQGVENV